MKNGKDPEELVNPSTPSVKVTSFDLPKPKPPAPVESEVEYVIESGAVYTMIRDDSGRSIGMRGHLPGTILRMKPSEAAPMRNKLRPLKVVEAERHAQQISEQAHREALAAALGHTNAATTK